MSFAISSSPFTIASASLQNNTLFASIFAYVLP
jgi:hypothetical protein